MGGRSRLARGLLRLWCVSLLMCDTFQLNSQRDDESRIYPTNKKKISKYCLNVKGLVVK